MIYFDNSATGGFKPYSVMSNAFTVMQHLSANPGRSGHRLALKGAELVMNTRDKTSSVFDCPPDRVIFTKNCTEALNTAIFGTAKKGGHVITTIYEHNSVLRPLYALQKMGVIELDIVGKKCNGDIIEQMEKKIKQNTYMIAMTAISNVTGQVLPVSEVGKLCKTHNIKFLVDGAQAGGHIPLSLIKDNISILCLAGHKGLNALMGTGLLLFDNDTNIEPLMYGGTGTESFSHNQPDVYPEKLEAGTLNLPGIVSLYEGLKQVEKNLDSFAVHLVEYTTLMITNLKKIKNVVVYSDANVAGIVAFLIKGMDSNVVADILSKNYDIAVRGGIHCAPLIHKALGTSECGLIRASLAVQNSTREIMYFIDAIKKIADS